MITLGPKYILCSYLDPFLGDLNQNNRCAHFRCNLVCLKGIFKGGYTLLVWEMVNPVTRDRAQQADSGHLNPQAGHICTVY